MKYLLVLLVVVVAAWLMLRRRDAPPPADPPPESKDKPKAHPKAKSPQPMLACAHCGVHLPKAEAQLDSAGRPFCSEAHRLAGPL